MLKLRAVLVLTSILQFVKGEQLCRELLLQGKGGGGSCPYYTPTIDDPFQGRDSYKKEPCSYDTFHIFTLFSFITAIFITVITVTTNVNLYNYNNNNNMNTRRSFRDNLELDELVRNGVSLFDPRILIALYNSIETYEGCI